MEHEVSPFVVKHGQAIARARSNAIQSSKVSMLQFVVWKCLENEEISLKKCKKFSFLKIQKKNDS